MDFGICLIPVGQMRHQPGERNELVTQVLFGETMTILERKESWMHVKLYTDNYSGWISEGQIQPISEDEFITLNTGEIWLSNDLVQILENKTRKTHMLVSAGSQFYNCEDNGFFLAGDEYLFHGSMSKIGTYDISQLISHACLFLNAPYLWGGKSALGIDCSGFSQLIYKLSGLNIARDASQQALQGEMINLLAEAVAGDLMFFDNEEGRITHVGLYLGENQIIHAHNHVRIDKVDHHGIFNIEKNKYSHKLRIIKRF
jgi:gamma-D-glutamyl-L-lysine dipeptidyl-peptidase